jgi:hypothetical protein
MLCMEKSTEKRQEQKERIQAEIERSLKVVEMKQTHAQIEEIERSRKKAAVLSVLMRLANAGSLIKGVYDELVKAKLPEELKDKKVDAEPNESFIYIQKYYESIREDLKNSLDLPEDNFEKTFPRIEMKYDSFNTLLMTLVCLTSQIADMKAYCMRYCL